MSEAERPVLLDTHYWLWLQADKKEWFAAGDLEAIAAAAQRGELLISAMSVWELAMLESKGRVELDLPCNEWVRQALDTPGLTLVPLTPEIAIESTRLPGSIKWDLSGRILVATARVMGARLATRDQKLIDYASQGHIVLC